MPKFLSIDPSTHNVGWATFDSGVKVRKGDWRKQWEWGFWKAEGRSREERMVDIKDRINEDVGDFDHLVIEYPTFFSSEAGQVAAHKNYTIDLAHICGFLAGWFHKDHRTYHPMTASEWKGSVSKEITMRKFCRIMKIKSAFQLTDHTIDAIMILRYFLQNYGFTVFQSVGEDFPESPLLQS